MRIAVVGSGYVGLVTAACLADSGNHVVAVDNDPRKVERLRAGHCPIFEPGLEQLMIDNMRSGRLRFTTDLPEGLANARVVFIAVGTPPLEDGSADLSAVEAVARDIATHQAGPIVVVTKSTVPVGTGDRLEALMKPIAKHPFSVVSNPEFLKEGTAVDDFLRPDRVVVGANEREAGETVAELYKPYVRNNRPILLMSRRASEMCKYAANAYLATRISFINEVADLCEQMDVNVDEVRRGMGSDQRVGHHFMYPGLGYGGSCFPKDVQALASTARTAGVTPGILDAVHNRNQAARQRLIARILARLGPKLAGQRVAVWGIAFKPNTDDIREAPAISIIEALLAAGAQVAAHDPKAAEPAREVFGGNVTFCDDAYAALEGAAALVICTEWMEYRSPDFDRIRAALKQPLIFDGRNIFELDQIRRYNFEYHSVGRPSLTLGG